MPSPSGEVRLLVEDVAVDFGGVHALKGVSFAFQQGEIFGLIGTNGAGKSTIIDVISGFTRPRSGAVKLNDKTLIGKSPDQIARMGLARTFQGVRLFGRLSVRDNVTAAGKVLGIDAAAVDACLEMMGLSALENQIAEELPYALQRRLGVARALALEPRVLLLDEPAAGMTPDEVADLGNTLEALQKQRGLALLLVEHNMTLVMSVCERIAVMDNGRTIAAGTPEEIRADHTVRAAYLGYSETE